ncbi:uncharacterized protein LOC117103268 [Anneissia japonica]|uniref:uncharacterized protein LOC117103268 n=1 Tax=Anneissia japonica TaxID=1529436 RepID=UPI0014259039|nr:uncharacterized protein LOC117103268 [Anneissia japonica]
MSGLRSFLYGRSVANQRIEAFWSYLQRLCSRFWINHLKDLQDRGLVDTSNDVHVECRFCLTDIIQRDFSRMARMWNQHRIRSQTNLEIPCGKPDILYFLPEIYGSRNYKFPLQFSDDDIEEVKRDYCDVLPEYGCSPVFAGGISEIIGNNLDNYTMPNTFEESTQLLLYLIDIFDENFVAL